MKKIILILLVFVANNSFAQKEKTTTRGLLNFEASVPLFEEVAATNNSVSYTLNIKTGALKSVVQMIEFRFKLSLMEEHFNKKYLESDQYPNAYFKGIIEGFNWNIIGNLPKEFNLKGEINNLGAEPQRY